MDFYTFFPKILNMSLTASVAIVFVILLRLLLKKAPKVISYALWGVVLFRLLCPVSFESGMSLFGLFETPTVGATDRTSMVEYIPSNIVHTEYPEVVLPVPGIGDTITEALPKGEEQLRADPLEGPIFIATYVWWGGILVMAIYGIVTWLQLRRRLVTASPLRENIYLADDIDSPFVMGLIRPKIYLPSEMEQREQSYIILHEQYHIRRLDHIVKALAFVALCIHWFNPLVWVAFILSGKDMEMSCDEAVVLKLGTEIRADYTASLLSLATGKRIIAGMPLAFGEGSTKGRIKNLANWKKPTFWVVLISVISCVVLTICLLTNPTGFKYNGSTTPISSATYFDFRAGVEGSTALNPAQISELISRLEEVKNTKKSDKFGGLTPGYQISAHLEDGSYIRISGYSLSDNEMVDIEWNDDRYVVSDSEFQDYLSRICAGGDTTQALGSFLINQPYGVVQVTYESPHFSFSMVAQENTPEYFVDENLHLHSVKEHSEYPDWTDLGVLSEISLTKDNFDNLFSSNSGDGWLFRESASAIRKNTKKAWTVIYDQDKIYYILQQENGELYLAYGYYDYSEKDDPGSDDTSIRWLYLLAKHTTNRNIGYSALYSEALIAEAFNVIEKEFGQRFSGSTLLELRYDDAIENRFADIIMNWDLDKGQELITVLTTFEKDGQKESCVWYLVRTEDKKSWEYVSWEYFSKKLSLNDIIILSQKGYDLSWADFEQYEYIETGFGLYIRRYEINDLFHFSIGGAGPNSEPMYMHLGANGDDPDAYIDIRDGGVTEFISEHNTAIINFTGNLNLGLNAEIVEIDYDNHILYVKDINKSAEVFGDRCAIDCSYAISRYNLCYVNYGDPNDVRTIDFSTFEVGDAIIIGMYDSEKENAFNGSAVAEQVQLSTQRLSAETIFSVNFAGNTSLQQEFVLTEDRPYWCILVENHGTEKISTEIGGEVCKIEPGTFDKIFSDEKGKPGTYSVSFATSGSFGMTGNAVCYTYKYRIEITGRLHNAVKDTTYILLTNIEGITFEQAWKASGLSSNMDDYFDPADAVFIGIR